MLRGSHVLNLDYLAAENRILAAAIPTYQSLNRETVPKIVQPRSTIGGRSA